MGYLLDIANYKKKENFLIHYSHNVKQTIVTRKECESLGTFVKLTSLERVE